MKTNILLFLIFSVLVGGCYTIYNHPDVVHKDNNNMVEIVEVTYKNDCQACHTTDELENYNYYVKKDVFVEPDSTDQSSELKYNDIAYFYNMPWWFEVELSNQYNEVKYETNYESVPMNRDGGTIYDGGGQPISPVYIQTLPPPTITRPTTNTGVSNSQNNNKSSGSENTTTTNSNSSGTSNTRGNDGSKNDGSRNNSSGRR